MRNFSFISNFKILFSLVAILTCIAPYGASAAPFTSRVYFETASTTVAPQSDFVVSVFVDADEPVNALDFQVVYPTSLEFKNLDTSNSIITFWQNGNTLVSPGHIRISGGIVPAFTGVHGLVASLHFHANTIGKNTFSFERTYAYIADGTGAHRALSGTPFSLSVAEGVSPLETQKVVTDTTNPILTFQIAKDPIKNTKLIIYDARDPESGIRIVEMRARTLFTWSSWVEVKNPVVYPAGTTSVQLRATNGVGLLVVQDVSRQSISMSIGEVVALFSILVIVILVYNKMRHSPKL